MAFDLIRDGIEYLTTPFPRHLRDMGYVRELRQLAARGKRRFAEWRPHTERTRSLILEAAERCSLHDKALIVGSGLLFDIPIADLSRRFREVVLVDILHLWQVRRAVGAYSNVRLEQLDVTGVAEEMHTAARRRRTLAEPQCKPKFFLDDGFDLVVSANILSQLPVVPNGYASRWKYRSTPEQVRRFSRRLVIDHLDWLASFSGNVCLIADLERLYCDGDKVVGREESLWGVDLPEGGRNGCGTWLPGQRWNGTATYATASSATPSSLDGSGSIGGVPWPARDGTGGAFDAASEVHRNRVPRRSPLPPRARSRGRGRPPSSFRVRCRRWSQPPRGASTARLSLLLSYITTVSPAPKARSVRRTEMAASTGEISN